MLASIPGDSGEIAGYGLAMTDMQSPAPDLETGRLRLRRLEPGDAPAAHLAYGDTGAMAFWDAPPSRDLAETEQRVLGWHAGDSDSRAGWAVLTRDDDRFIGMVNYHRRLPEHRRLAVGWILVLGFEGNGYMLEAAGALLAYCFDRLGTHRIEAEIHLGNTRSENLACRLGFQCEALLRDRLFAGDRPVSTHLYALLRPSWDDLTR